MITLDHNIHKLPQAGTETAPGMFLTELPSLNSPEEYKFAAVTDPRISHPEYYLSLQRFLPAEIKIVGPPIQLFYLETTVRRIPRSTRK